jgi:CRP-like cAMP-binding protein
MPQTPLQPEHTSAFRDFVMGKVTLTESEWARTVQSLEIQYAPAHTLLLREGEVCRHLYFANTGFVRFFVLSSDGKDTTKFLTQEHELFTSHESFSSQKPSGEYIEVLEDTEFLTISYTALQLLYEDVPKWHLFIRRVVQSASIAMERTYMDSITLTAEQRYQLLLRNEPNIALRAPLKHIASYLGITPESLSRIRKKIAETR